MRLSPLSLPIAIAVVSLLVQSCATAPESAAVNLRALGGGKCQVLDKSFPCDEVVDALTEAGVAKTAKIQVQLLPGFTVGEAAKLLNTLTNALRAAGFNGVSKTAVAIPSNDS
jgi:hypothetical protein